MRLGIRSLWVIGFGLGCFVVLGCSSAPVSSGGLRGQAAAPRGRNDAERAAASPDPALRCERDADCVALENVCYGWIYVNHLHAEKRRGEIIRQKRLAKCSIPGSPEASDAAETGEILPHAPPEPKCFQHECTSERDVRMRP